MLSGHSGRSASSRRTLFMGSKHSDSAVASCGSSLAPSSEPSLA